MSKYLVWQVWVVAHGWDREGRMAIRTRLQQIRSVRGGNNKQQRWRGKPTTNRLSHSIFVVIFGIHRSRLYTVHTLFCSILSHTALFPSKLSCCCYSVWRKIFRSTTVLRGYCQTGEDFEWARVQTMLSFMMRAKRGNFIRRTKFCICVCMCVLLLLGSTKYRKIWRIRRYYLTERSYLWWSKKSQQQNTRRRYTEPTHKLSNILRSMWSVRENNDVAIEILVVALTQTLASIATAAQNAFCDFVGFFLLNTRTNTQTRTKIWLFCYFPSPLCTINYLLKTKWKSFGQLTDSRAVHSTNLALNDFSLIHIWIGIRFSSLLLCSIWNGIQFNLVFF